MTKPAKRRSSAPLAAAAGVLATVAGCVSDEPARRAVAPQPAGVRPATLFLSADLPDDTDGNGYVDTVDVTIYVFGEGYEAAPIFVPGTFEFSLNHRGGPEMAGWTLTPDQAAGTLRRFAPGPGYRIRLSLLDLGLSDVMPAQEVDLAATFTAAAGEARANSTALRFGHGAR